MRDDNRLVKQIAKMNFVTADRVVLYPPLYDGSPVVDFDLLYPESRFEENRRQKFTAKLNEKGGTLNKKSVKQVF